jgi:hypothetical protein
VARAPIHDRLVGVQKRAIGELAFRGLDGVHQGITLLHTDDEIAVLVFLRDVYFRQRVDHFAEACRIDRHAIQQPGVLHPADEFDDPGNIAELVVDDGQVRRVRVGKALQHTCDGLAALKHATMAPCMRPRQPALDPLLDVIAVLDRIDDSFGFFAAENGEPEQIVQSAAIDSDNDNLASFKQAFEGECFVCLAFPKAGAGPAIASDARPNLEIEVLAQPDPLCVLALCLFAVPVRNER